MLELERKINEKIFIGKNKLVTVTLLSIDVEKGTAKLGFIAPKDIEIYREEFFIKQQKLAREIARYQVNNEG